jgi:uncharacterized protein (TIGR02265 family)
VSSEGEPVEFSTVVEGARRAFARQLTPELLARLKATGMDFLSPLPAYPMDTFLQALNVLAEAVLPGQPREAQHRKLGRDFMQGYVETALGRAVLTMARVVGVRRTLLRVGRSLKTTGNYVEAAAREDGPDAMHLTISVLPEFRARITPAWAAVAWYRRGVFEGTLEQLGVQGSVEPLDNGHGAAVVEYRISWKPR